MSTRARLQSQWHESKSGQIALLRIAPGNSKKERKKEKENKKQTIVDPIGWQTTLITFKKYSSLPLRSPQPLMRRQRLPTHMDGLGWDLYQSMRGMSTLSRSPHSASHHYRL